MFNTRYIGTQPSTRSMHITIKSFYIYPLRVATLQLSPFKLMCSSTLIGVWFRPRVREIYVKSDNNYKFKTSLSSPINVNPVGMTLNVIDSETIVKFFH